MNDDRLRDAFGELRRQEAARMPRFEQLWKWRPPRRRFPVASLAFAVLVLITGTFVVLHRAQPAQRPAITEWRAPTDFLLNTPGRELIDSVPDLKGTIR
jgi:hypothetical protein